MIATYLGIPLSYAITDKKLTTSFSNVGQGGSGSISGKVTELGLVVARRVMLYERFSGLLIATTWSKPDGSYQFSNINEQLSYYVVALDENGDAKQYNAVIQDLLPGNYDKMKAAGQL